MVNIWGEGLMNTFALLIAINNKTGSELISMTVVEDIVEFSLEKGDSKYVMTLHIDKLSSENVMDVIANMTTLARMEHAAAAYPINKRLH